MFKELLKSKKISITSQRIEILEKMTSLHEPVTIEFLSTQLSHIDKVTLYRSLALFVSNGIVYQTDFREGVSYYELQDKNHHHHLVCTKCKIKIELSHCPKIPVDDIAQETGFVVESHMFEIFGICSKCIKEK